MHMAIVAAHHNPYPPLQLLRTSTTAGRAMRYRHTRKMTRALLIAPWATSARP